MIKQLHDNLEESSHELGKLQVRNHDLSDKLVTLEHEKEKEVAALRNELAQKSDLLNMEVANMEIVMHQLAEKDKIINQMKATYAEVEVKDSDKAKKENKARAGFGGGSKVAGFIRKKFLPEKQLTSK